MAAKPKFASYLLHQSNYIDVFNNLNSQVRKGKRFEIAINIKKLILHRLCTF